MHFAEGALVSLAAALQFHIWYARMSGGRGTKPKGKKVHVTVRGKFLNELESRGMDVSRYEGAMPKRYEKVGHVVIVKLNTNTTVAQMEAVSMAFAASLSTPSSNVDVVLLDQEGIRGELREPTYRCLWAAGPLTEKTFHTTHVEAQTKYSFDAMKIMFCSGNTTERMHFGTMVNAKGQTVVDMFAGIGYFTLPLCRSGGRPDRLYAIEKNPNSFLFLVDNVELNNVAETVVPILGDNREVGDELKGRCDRVLMGYIPGCDVFLPRAVQFLRQRGPRLQDVAGSSTTFPVGRLHYHLISKITDVRTTAFQDLVKHCMHALEIPSGGSVHDAVNVSIEAVRVVKSYSPHLVHAVADILFE